MDFKIIARIGSGVVVSESHIYGSSIEPSFNDCSFLNNSAQYTSSEVGQYAGRGAFYTDSVPVHFYGSTFFLSNFETAVVLVGGWLRFHSGCVANLSGNSGYEGGAVALLGQKWKVTQLSALLETRLTFGVVLFLLSQ